MPTPVAPRKRLSVWGLLARVDEERIALLIDTVAQRFCTPTFRPHITLVSDVKGGEAEARDAVRIVAGVTPRITLGVQSVTHSSQVFRAVVLECGHGDEALQRLRDVLARDLIVRDQKPFRPHVSVVYGLLGEEERRAVAIGAEEQVGQTITIASLSLVDTGSDDAGAWSSPFRDFALRESASG